MTGLAWMYGRDLPLLSLTFARDLTPRQLLARMGADPSTLRVRDRDRLHADFGGISYDRDAYLVSAGRYGSWAWVWEDGSRLCAEDKDLVLRVSTGTAALVLSTGEKPIVDFRYAEDRQLITGFHTALSLRAADRTGSDPHRFDADLRALGADPERDEHAVNRRQ